MQDPFRRIMIISGSIIFGSIVVFFLLFAWLGSDLTSQSDGIAAARQAVEDDARAIESFSLLKRSEEEAKQYASRLNSLLPSSGDLLSFSRWVTTTGRDAQVNAQAVFKSTPPKGVPGTIGSANFTLDAVGPYETLKDFLYLVENKAPRYLVAYDSITVAREGEQYHATIGGRVFFKY